MTFARIAQFASRKALPDSFFLESTPLRPRFQSHKVIRRRNLLIFNNKFNDFQES